MGLDLYKDGFFEGEVEILDGGEKREGDEGSGIVFFVHRNGRLFLLLLCVPRPICASALVCVCVTGIKAKERS